MKVYEMGSGESVMLLHGGGLSRWSCRALAEKLSLQFRVLLPVLDGHAESGYPFTSIEDNARRLIGWVDEHCGGELLALCGLSLGGQTALEMLTQRNNICRLALLESVSVIPDPLTAALIGPSFGLSFGLIQQRWFSKLQFSYLRLPRELFEEYYRDSCAIEKTDLIAFTKASCSYSLKEASRNIGTRVLIAAGEREQGRIRRSARLLDERLQDSRCVIWPGLYHGELSMKHPEEYARLLMEEMT